MEPKDFDKEAASLDEVLTLLCVGLELLAKNSPNELARFYATEAYRANHSYQASKAPKPKEEPKK